MPPIAVDYLREPGRRWIGWALLGAGVLLALDLGHTRNDLEMQLATWRVAPKAKAEARLARVQPADARPGKSDEQAREDAALVIQQLTLPWSSLFRSVELAHSDGVALLSLQPDAQRGSISISGEAKEYGEILSYVARLREQRSLSDVYLVANEVKEDTPQRPLVFTVAARWKRVQ